MSELTQNDGCKDIRVPAAITDGHVKHAAMRKMAANGRLRIVLAFSLTCIAFYALVPILPPLVMEPFIQDTASALGAILNALGVPALAVSDTVSGRGVAFRVIPECTAIFSVWIFLSFVLFYTSTLREKAAGLLIGIPVLYFGNLIRLTATYLVSRHDPGFFDVAHVYLGQLFSILLIVMVCFAWIKRIGGEEKRQVSAGGTTGFLGRFVLISVCLFVIWTRAQYLYMGLVDAIARWGAALFGNYILLDLDSIVYYETFSIPVFASLVLAARLLPTGTRFRGLGLGLGFLFLTHIIHRTDNILLVCLNISSLVPVDLALLEAGQYLLPVLWIIFLVHFRRQNGNASCC